MDHPCDLSVILLYNLDPAWSEAEKDEIRGLTRCLADGLSTSGHPTWPVCLEDADLAAALAGFDPAHCLVFNWCEEIPGVYHSAGLVARKLEELGFAYTGADSQALEGSYDKPAVKERLARRGVLVPRWLLCESPEAPAWDAFPAIVKPAYEHSSVGITREAVVHDREELARQVERVRSAFRQPVLIEDFIDGREFHVTVVGNGRLQVFPVAEMDFSAIAEDCGRLCTYDSKFVPTSPDYQMIQLCLPAELNALEKEKLEAAAVAAYRATGCRDYARLDIRQREDAFYVLDVNPNADLSPDTSVTLSAELAGYPYGQFGSLLVNLAARRHPLLSRQHSRRAQQAQPVFFSTG